MFDLQTVLEQRLKALEGKGVKKPEPNEVLLNDTSKEYIIRSLTQAGILDEQGNVRELIIDN